MSVKKVALSETELAILKNIHEISLPGRLLWDFSQPNHIGLPDETIQTYDDRLKSLKLDFADLRPGPWPESFLIALLSVSFEIHLHYQEIGLKNEGELIKIEPRQPIDSETAILRKFYDLIHRLNRLHKHMKLESDSGMDWSSQSNGAISGESLKAKEGHLDEMSDDNYEDTIYCLDHTCDHAKRNCDDCEHHYRKGMYLYDFLGEISYRLAEYKGFKFIVYSKRRFPFVHVKDAYHNDSYYNLSEDVWEFFGNYADLGDNLGLIKDWIRNNQQLIEKGFEYVDSLTAYN